jgi:hypothetical protein
MTQPNYVVVLPPTVAPVELPATSEESFNMWDERVLSDGDTRVTSDGSIRLLADSSQAVNLQIALVVLPSNVTPVQVK